MKKMKPLLISLIIGLLLGLWFGVNIGKGKAIFSNPFSKNTIESTIRESGEKVLEKSGKALEETGKALRETAGDENHNK